MITLESMRTALLSDQPYAKVDGLIRREQIAGRPVDAIFDQVNPLLEELLATPGLSEAGEEALLGVLDALTGACHPGSRYVDPINTGLTVSPVSEVKVTSGMR